MSVDETYTDPLEKIAGETEVEIECTTPRHEPDLCDGWSETVELDEQAHFSEDGERIHLPGFSWECPECGNPHDFVIEGVEVTNIV